MDINEINEVKVMKDGKNYTAKSMIIITLDDDDTYMVTATENEIIMRDGTKKRLFYLLNKVIFMS